MTKPDPFSIDDENEELSEGDFARMRPAREVHGDGWVDAQLKRQRGRPKVERPKTQVTLRLDSDILDDFKRAGRGWQSRINEALSLEVAAFHVVPDDGRWWVQLPRGERLKVYATQAEAVEVATSMARKVETVGKPARVVLHARA